ncbi:hypothetical protein ACN27F_08140 [Solwaraspora sp. WMMB335]|uniref:hypothetical protein n=1 Tax=Solwaraspora sp. WMMB335 TaxID=3404118 RepID=UPI003B92F321
MTEQSGGASGGIGQVAILRADVRDPEVLDARRHPRRFGAFGGVAYRDGVPA